MNKKRHSERRGLGRKREIRILQHNMQRSKTIPYEIRTQMDADGDDIILMQEPYSVDGKIPGFGTGVAIACRGSKYDPPMAAVGIKSETLTPLEVAELCTTHCSCVQIGDGETEVYAASLVLSADSKHQGRRATVGEGTTVSQRQEDHHRPGCERKITAVVQQEHRRQRRSPRGSHSAVRSPCPESTRTTLHV